MAEARDRLERAFEVKLVAVDGRQAGIDGVFEGYASLFNKEDLGRDVVLPGAFRASLRSRPVPDVRMLFQHDPNQPIGVWERIHEDARGLFVRGRLALDVARAREVHALMRAGAVDGLSIGFRAVKGRRDRLSGVRRLVEIDLWEISVVTFPMLPGARVAAVKSEPPAGRRLAWRDPAWERQLTLRIAEAARLIRRNTRKQTQPARS